MKRRIIPVVLTLLVVSVLLPAFAWASLTKTEVSQLYIAVFGRASEGSGNLYWQTDPVSTSLAATAETMLNTTPAREYFGQTLSDNESFIEHIYLNTLGKTYSEDPDGINYWVDGLNNGKSKGEVIAALIIAAQHPNNAGDAQKQFNNKVEVSNYCADTITEFTDLNTFAEFTDSVTWDSYSVSTAKTLIDNNTPYPPECVDLNGKQYAVKEVVDPQSCGDSKYSDQFYVTLNQNGCDIYFVDSYGVWGSGTISGNKATVTSTWYEDGGKVDAVYTISFSDDKNLFSGSGTATWTDGYSTCYPTSTISGQIID